MINLQFTQFLPFSTYWINIHKKTLNDINDIVFRDVCFWWTDQRTKDRLRRVVWSCQSFTLFWLTDCSECFLLSNIIYSFFLFVKATFVQLYNWKVIHIRNLCRSQYNKPNQRGTSELSLTKYSRDTTGSTEATISRNWP